VIVDGRNGVLQHAEVYGDAMCNCMLSKMPRLTLTFTTPHVIEDAALHMCANRERWERERIISFVPPDGKFELFSYRVARTNHIPIYVTPNISFSETTPPPQQQQQSADGGAGGGGGGGGGGGEGGGVVDVSDGAAAGAGESSQGGVGHISVTLGARPTDGKVVEEVAVRIPLPPSTTAAPLTASVGSVVYDPQAQEVRWHIGRIPKDKLPILNGSVALGPGRSARELSLSLFVQFKVVMFSASGLRVASLRVENEEHQPYKGVRSITRAGRFEVRC
jgi:AP-3 complex subunit mu